jgi:hypothetical protein
MVDQLFRQEAVDGYTERWLGEVSELCAIPQLTLASLGIGMLTTLITVLIFGSYGRQTTLRGVISGAREEVVITSASIPSLHVGEDLPVNVKAANAAGGPFRAQIASIATSSISSGPLYRVTLEIPTALRREVGARFSLQVPLERRHIYQWMFPCFSN